MNIEYSLRKLAKNNYWQTLYSHTKESGALKLFYNDYDLSSIQLEFLAYLGFYNALFFDIALGEIGEIVLENEIYEDAYNYYKIKSRNKGLKKEVQKNMTRTNKLTEDIKIGENKWVFPRVKGSKN